MTEHVLATFTRRTEALAASRQVRAEFPDLRLRLGDTDDALDAMALAQRDEMAETVPVMAAGPFSGPFARGALVWGAVGLVVGAVMALPFVLLFDTGISGWLLAAYFAAAGGLALASATFILGAGHQAEREGAMRVDDPEAVIRAEGPPHDLAEVRTFLVEHGARTVRIVMGDVGRPATDDVEEPSAHRPSAR